MKNKKLKLVVLSATLTACVAAQPLAAHAATGPRPVRDDPPADTDPDGETPVPAGEITSAGTETTNPEGEKTADVLAPDTDVVYDHDKDVTTPNEDGSITTDATGDVVKPAGEDETAVIGSADRSETETKDTTVKLDPDTAHVADKTTTTNPDGSTTTTTTTVTEGTESTTTTVSGKADGETHETTTETKNDGIDLVDEIGTARIDWTTGKDDKVGDYTVKNAETSSDGNSKTLTLSRTETVGGEDDPHEMTGEDIAKLLEAGYCDNGDGTYTLTKEYTYTDADGNQQTGTTTIQVDASSATKTTTTTLTVTVAKTERPGSEHAQTEVKPDDTDTTLTDDETGNPAGSINLAELLHKEGTTRTETTDADGNKVITVIDGSKTYTITYGKETGTDLDLSGLSADEIAGLLGKEKGYYAEDGKVYDSEGHELTIDASQKLLFHVKIDVSVEDSRGGRSEEQITGGEAARDDAANSAQKEAILDALVKAAAREGLTLTAEDFTLSDDHTATASAGGKSYTFTYSEGGVTLTGTKELPITDPDHVADSRENTLTGTAYVSGVTSQWTTTEHSSILKEDSYTEGIRPDYDFTKAPEGAKILEQKDGYVTKYELNGKIYTFEFTFDAEVPEGLTGPDYSNQHFTKVSWTVTSPASHEEEVVEEVTKNADLRTGDDWELTETGDGTFSITLNGVTYSDLTTEDDGRTYKSTSGDTTITITVSTRALTADEIRVMLAARYNNTVQVDADGKATYTDESGQLRTIDYTSSGHTTLTVQTDVASTATATAGSEKEAYERLLEEIKKAQADAEANGKQLVLDGKTITKTITTVDDIKDYIHAVNFGSLKGEDLIRFLESQRDSALAPEKEADKDAYTGKSYTDSSNNCTNRNTISHLDLGTDSTLTTLDNGETDCILNPDKDISLVWNKNASDLVNNKNNQKVGLISRVTFDNENGNGKGHYEFPRASWDGPSSTPDNYPEKSAFYRVTGTVAYDSLKNADGSAQSFNSKEAAEEALEQYKSANPRLDLSQASIIAVYPNQDKKSTPSYRVYLHQSEMTAYGYLTKSSNTCDNKTFERYTDKDDKIHYTGKYIGGYDLLLSKLTQVSETQITGEQYKSYSYALDFITRDLDTAHGQSLTLRSTRYSHTVQDPDHTEGTGSRLWGSYDVQHTETTTFDDTHEGTQCTGVQGTGSGTYQSFWKFLTTRASGQTNGTRYNGALHYTYRSEQDPDVTLDEKTTQVDTNSSVEYHYTHTETQTVLSTGRTSTTTPAPLTPSEPTPEPAPIPTPAPPAQGEVIVTPAEPSGPEIIAELPAETPEPAPAPITTISAPVQGAHALPQTGVNWITAFGMACSGLLLMLAGTVTNRLYKEKH